MSLMFPAGLAMGEAFYDRVNERQFLKKNITHGLHTVLIAPRRFGKTSLIKKTLDEMEILYLWLDFMAITSQEEAQIRFLNHIGELVIKIAKTEERLKKIAPQYFQLFKPEISLGIPGFLKISFKADNIPQVGISAALISLDLLAQASGIRLAIVCDEFQEIVGIDKEATLQASIRHAAERAQAITYLFSGSKHRPLRRLFNGKQNPLYELCDQMTLNRISEEDYREYLQQEAKKKWGHPLGGEVLRKIFYYTDYYPKYINALCAKIWFSGLEPTPELVDTLWGNYIFSKKSDIAEELDDLTLNQRKLLKYLCFNPTEFPFSHETSLRSGMPASAIQTALPVLLDRDLVIELEGIHTVLDPTFRSYFEMF